MQHILDRKLFNFITLDRILGIAFMFLLVFSTVFMFDSFNDHRESERLALEEAQRLAELQVLIDAPASDWIEYISIEPAKEIFDNVEDIQLISHSVQKKSALVHWNDILYCDVDGDGLFSYAKNSDTNKFVSVTEPRESVQPWFYVEENKATPVGSLYQCHVLSQQDICPPELAGVAGAECKYQEIQSAPFTLMNRGTI